ncbi:glycosyltransferase family 4 protein [Acidisoma cladoniae]|uniref:glycosyltransferase family 4 protein n=1 Tax=Acidisoma cladoniae TaxID=3040935 RepID=UPI00254BB994|nr:glycosyltransferase family 4 protein [Acidisoma sp. PAMC 29798]
MTATRPRIVFFAPHFAEYSVRLALALSKRARVLLIVEGKNLREECNARLIAQARETLDVSTFDGWSRKGRLLATGLITARIIAFRPDLVHVQEQPDKLPALITSWLRRFYPVLLTVHDPQPHTGRDLDYSMRVDAFRKRLRAAASAFHVHGAYCHAQLVNELGIARPITVTQHGVILVPDAEQQMEPVPGRILMFGRMEAYKGVEVLLDAADLLSERGVPHRIVLAGRGPELERLRARSASMSNVDVIDKFLTPAEAVREFQQACVVVTPYVNATQSGVVAAAFGNTRPVVASAVGGLVDAVRDDINGLLVEPARPDRLADDLARVVMDPALQHRLSAGVRTAAVSDFAWGAIAEKLHEAYRGLIAVRKASAPS